MQYDAWIYYALLFIETKLKSSVQTQPLCFLKAETECKVNSFEQLCIQWTPLSWLRSTYLWRRPRSWRQACSWLWRTEGVRSVSPRWLLCLLLSSRTLYHLWCSRLWEQPSTRCDFHEFIVKGQNGSISKLILTESFDSLIAWDVNHYGNPATTQMHLIYSCQYFYGSWDGQTCQHDRWRQTHLQALLTA